MTPRARFRFGFRLVFEREFNWLRRRLFLLSLITVMPLALMALLTFIFSAELATRLPIGVLDLDGSDLSRSIIRTVDATPDAATSVRVAELSEGRQRLLTKDIYGLLLIPRNFERDVVAGRRPEVVFFYNTQRMTTGNLVLRGVNNAIAAASGGIRLSLRGAQGEPIDIAQSSLTPIPVQVHGLFNPSLNYAHFLLAALLPSILMTVIVTATCYTMSLDIETVHRLRILRRLGNGLWFAMAGKLLPYTLIFLLVLGSADAILFGVFALPLQGNPAILLAAGLLFIVACQLLGAFLALTLGASAIGIGTLLTAPAFGFMGVGFPRHGMNNFAYGFGEALPGTWYLMARIDQTIRGTPIDLALKPLFVLLAFVILFAGLCAWRLQSLGRVRNTVSPARQAAAGGVA